MFLFFILKLAFFVLIGLIYENFEINSNLKSHQFLVFIFFKYGNEMDR